MGMCDQQLHLCSLHDGRLHRLMPAFAQAAVHWEFALFVVGLWFEVWYTPCRTHLVGRLLVRVVLGALALEECSQSQLPSMRLCGLRFRRSFERVCSAMAWMRHRNFTLCRMAQKEALVILRVDSVLWFVMALLCCTCGLRLRPQAAARLFRQR